MPQRPRAKVGDRLSYVSELLTQAFPFGRGVIKDYRIQLGDPILASLNVLLTPGILLP